MGTQWHYWRDETDSRLARKMQKEVFEPKQVSEDLNLKRIETPFLQLSDVDDNKDVQVEAAFFPYCPFGESHRGSRFTPNSQFMTAFSTSSIMSLFHGALGKISNDTMNMIIKLFPDSNVLKSGFEKPANE